MQIRADGLLGMGAEGVVLNSRGNATKTGLPLADTHYVVRQNGEKRCFVYVYETDGAMMLLVKASRDYVKSLREKYPEVHESAFPKSKEPWSSVVLDDTFTDDDVKKLLAYDVCYRYAKAFRTEKGCPFRLCLVPNGGPLSHFGNAQLEDWKREAYQVGSRFLRLKDPAL